MKTIRTTVEGDSSNGYYPTHNAKLLVMTDEDALRIKDTFEKSIVLHNSIGDRFDALESVILLQGMKIDILEKIIREMIGD